MGTKHFTSLRLGSLVFGGLLLSSPAGFGAVVYDEAASNDLSNSGLTPTQITVGEGENIVLGSYGKIDNVVDRDYFTFTVPNGLNMVAISVLANETSDPGTAFIGMQSGNQVTLPTNPPDATGLLGWLHFTANSGNIITDMGIPAGGSTGYTPPLAPGSYAFWVQEAAAGPLTYGLDFQLVAAPESGPGLALLAGTVALFAVARRLVPAVR